MKKIFLLFLFVCFVGCVFGQTEAIVDSLMKLSKHRTSNYIDKSGQLKGYYEIDQTGVTLYATPADKKSNKAECKIYWNEIDVYKNILNNYNYDSCLTIYTSKKNIPFNKPFNFSKELPQKYDSLKPKGILSGLKIAIDPGHVSGNLETAKIEAKFLKFEKDSTPFKEGIEIIEGNLTIATALHLKEKLEAEGAEVMLTRDRVNSTAYGISFHEWAAKAGKSIKGQSLKNQQAVFQNHFKMSELKERASKINEFHPDFTIIIHYNVDEKNNRWSKPTLKNFNMTFVGGNIKSEYMKNVSNRFELLRLIMTDDLDKSMFLSANVSERFESKLNVPLAKESDAVYLKDESLSTVFKGVYCRNLVLTRLVHGPLVYGESLYQDNINECRLLNEKNLEINGVKTNKRVKEVADAYYEGILKFIQGGHAR